MNGLNTICREPWEPANRYEYEVQCNYGYGWETVTVEPDRAAAEEMRECYIANERVPTRVKRVLA